MSAGDLDTELTVVEGRVNAAREELRVASDLGMPAQRRLQRAVEKVGESASGSWIGYHARLYYGRFQRPPGSIPSAPSGANPRASRALRGARSWELSCSRRESRAPSTRPKVVVRPVAKQMLCEHARPPSFAGIRAQSSVCATHLLVLTPGEDRR